VNEEDTRRLGAWLRQRREELGIDLEQVEADTRIRTRYLEALEAEDFDALPDPVVGRGFLRNYAAYLDLDPQEASDRYSAMVAPPEPESVPPEQPSPFTAEPFRPVPLHKIAGPGSRRRLLFGLAAVVLVVALAVLIWWGNPLLGDWLSGIRPAATSTGTSPTQETSSVAVPTSTRTPTATAAATLALETAAPTQTPSPEPTRTPTLTASPSPSPSPPVYTGIFLELFFTDISWIQVTVDGVRQFQGELEADTYRSWYGEERIELRIGNAGGVEVTVNGEKLGNLGEEDEVVDRVFEKVGSGVTEATVTPVSTGDLTAEPTEAPTAEPTVEPTAQPTEAPTAELTVEPSAQPTEAATAEPTVEPIAQPTEAPSAEPTVEPSAQPTETPSAEPTAESPTPEASPTVEASPTGEVTPTTTP
jgi:cytoskeletal protein RodZ